ARAQALQIDLHGLGRFFLPFLLFLLFLFFGFLFAAPRVSGFFFVFLFFRFFLIALGLERRSFVRLQSNGENPIGGVVVVTLVQLPAARIKIPRGKKEQIFPGGFKEIGRASCRERGKNKMGEGSGTEKWTRTT